MRLSAEDLLHHPWFDDMKAKLKEEESQELAAEVNGVVLEEMKSEEVKEEEKSEEEKNTEEEKEEEVKEEKNTEEEEKGTTKENKEQKQEEKDKRTEENRVQNTANSQSPAHTEP